LASLLPVRCYRESLDLSRRVEMKASDAGNTRFEDARRGMRVCDSEATHRRRRNSLCSVCCALLFLPMFSSCCCCNAFAPAVSIENRQINALQGSSYDIDIEHREEGCMRLSFRIGEPSDQFIITKTLVSELMNPLGLNPKRFCVAENNDGQVVGWGQLKPLGVAKYDASKYNSSPGSGRIEDSIDEDIWLEFEEDDDIDFPNGLSSLPWSPSYLKAAEAARQRREKRVLMVGKERMKTPQMWELSSLYVFPPYRSQGVGKSIVRELFRQHLQLERDVRQIYALTLRKTFRQFYDALGFKVVEEEDIPNQMKLELAVGRIITKILGEELVCLRVGDGNRYAK
jgi:N-acetylglutamate synthase-like GNAT family acetyltransferase